MSMTMAQLRDQSLPNILRYREACTVPSAGDLMDVFPGGGNDAVIVIADVCGRDEQAFEHALYLRSAVRALSGDPAPARLIEIVNRKFVRRVTNGGDDRFATLFVARLSRRRLTYASAGHDCALLVRADGQHSHLPPTGTIVGIDEGERYTEKSIYVAPGDCLVLVTDGVTDARDSKGTFFGTTGVLRSALTAISAGMDDPAAQILKAAQTYGGQRFADDASVICVHFS